MIHGNRRFGVYEVASVGELVENFTQHTWTLCTAFSLENLLFLNDSFSEDRAQEYAVVRDGRQIESLTVSWMSRAEAHNTYHLKNLGLKVHPLAGCHERGKLT